MKRLSLRDYAERVTSDKTVFAESKRLVSYLYILFRLNTKAALALRGSFLVSAVSMFINNFIFFITWLILFNQVETIGGWQLRDCALMFGLVAVAFGTMLIVTGGVWNMARHISEGGLDTFLTTPRPVLASILASRSIVSGWGDLFSGLVLIVAAGYYTPLHIVLIVVTAGCSAVMFLMTGVILHSAAFWFGPVNQLSRQLHEFLLTFSLYPGPIYGGWLRYLIFTAVPAGFISTFPVELIRDLSIWKLGAVLIATAFYTVIALSIFRAGLRRYESGNQIGMMV
jgi:ABC-2 type transport system permease protein